MKRKLRLSRRGLALLICLMLAANPVITAFSETEAEVTSEQKGDEEEAVSEEEAEGEAEESDEEDSEEAADDSEEGSSEEEAEEADDDASEEDEEASEDDSAAEEDGEESEADAAEEADEAEADEEDAAEEDAEAEEDSEDEAEDETEAEEAEAEEAEEAEAETEAEEVTEEEAEAGETSSSGSSSSAVSSGTSSTQASTETVVLTATVGDIVVTVTAEPGVLPDDDGLKLKVKKITDEETLKELEETACGEDTDAEEDSEEDEDGVTYEEEFIAFDITILDGEGEEVQPDTSKGTITVTITNLLEDGDELLALYHFEQDGEEASELDVTVEDGDVSFEAEHFSTYAGSVRRKASSTTVTAVISGTSGGIDYVLDTDYTLTISASESPESGYDSGVMADYDTSSEQPWYSYQDSITKVVVEDDVTVIGNRAFQYCESVSDLEIAESVTWYGVNAFQNITVESFEVGANVTFEASLPTVEDDEGVTISSGNKCFFRTDDESDDIYYIWEICDDDNELNGDSGDVYLRHFSGNDKDTVTEIVIPASATFDGETYYVTAIGNPEMEDEGYLSGYVFMYAESATSIELPSSVTAVASASFYECAALVSMDLKYVTDLGTSLFSGCAALSSVTLSSSLTEIPNSLFEGCASLESVSVDGEDSDSAVNLPDGVTYIGRKAFQNCSSISGTIDIPSSCEEIDDYAFLWCNKLEEVTGGESLKTLGDNTFLTTGITTVDLEGTAFLVIPDGTFGRNSSPEVLTSFSLKNGAFEDGYTFYTKDKLETLYLGGGVSKVPDSMFASQTALSSVEFGEGLETIGSKAFQSCTALTEVVLPDSVETIGTYAFASCTELETAIMGSGLESLNNYVFNACTSLKALDMSAVESEEFLSDVTANVAGNRPTGSEVLFVYCASENVASTWKNGNFGGGYGNVRVADVDGGTFAEDTEFGDTLATPEKTGYTFGGWYSDSSYTTKVTDSTTLSANYIYYAKWFLSDIAVTVSADKTYISSSDTATLTATVESDSDGLTYSYQWYTVSDDTYTEISDASESTYEVSNLSAETSYACTVTATDSDGGTSNATSSSVTISVSENSTTLTISSEDLTISEDAAFVDYNSTGSYGISATVTYSGSELSDVVITYTSSDESVATISSDTITIVGIGETTITASYVGNSSYSSSSDSFTLTVSGASIEEATVGDISEYTYTGSAIKPTISVTLNGTSLMEDTDYTVSYSNNTDAGTATVTIIGTGSYNGTVTKTFNITAASISNAVITLSGSSYVYNGSARTPGVNKVTLNGTTLTAGTDYTVSYSVNTDAGTATVTITGKGNYTGAATATFTISKASTTVSIIDVEASYGTAYTQEATVSGTALSDDAEAIVTYYTDTAYASEWTATGSETSPVDVGTYYAVATYEGDGNHEGSYATATLTIVKSDISYTASGYSGVYDGGTHSITVTADDEDVEILYSSSEEGDYTSSAIGYSDAGTYIVYWKISDSNYNEASGFKTVEITKASLTASYAGESIACGETPALEVTVTGFIDGEDESTAAGYEAPTVTATSTAEGTYTLTPEGGSASNYEFTAYESGTLVISHSWGSPLFTWTATSSGYSATATFTCSCGETETVDADVTSETATDGSIIYTAALTGPDGVEYTDTQTDETEEETEAETEVEEETTTTTSTTSKTSSSSSSSSSSNSRSTRNTTSTGTINAYDGSSTMNWEKDETGWRAKSAAGGYLASTWYKLEWNGVYSWYYFGDDEYMITGWYTDGAGNTYYLHNVSDGTMGHMYTGWHLIGGKYYYFEEAEGDDQGKLYRSTTTPDGYTVDITGARVY